MELIQVGTIGFREKDGQINLSKPLYAKQTRGLKQAQQKLFDNACAMIIEDLKKEIKKW